MGQRKKRLMEGGFWSMSDNVTTTEDAAAADALKRYGIECALRQRIADSFYNQAAAYEAKKKLAPVGSFRQEYNETMQAAFLLAAKHVEHWPLENPLEES